MLNSTFYFKNIECPFAKSGSCQRPYCHFKHDKSKGRLITHLLQKVLLDFIVQGLLFTL